MHIVNGRQNGSFLAPHGRNFCLKGVRCVVVTGAETDVCVLSTVLAAVDRGFRVVIVEDALCSSSDAGHEALMTIYRTRMQEQIDLVNSSELFDLWNAR